jgi:hypothetical protein
MRKSDEDPTILPLDTLGDIVMYVFYKPSDAPVYYQNYIKLREWQDKLKIEELEDNDRWMSEFLEYIGQCAANWRTSNAI